MSYVSGFVKSLGTIFVMTTLVTCKILDPQTSDEKRFFKQDIPANVDSWRRTKDQIDPSDYPFILSTPSSGCTAFVVDKDAGVAMTAYHCNPEIGNHICAFAKKSPKTKLTRDQQKDPARFTENWFDSTECPVEGVIRGFIEKGVQGEYDFVLFKFDLLKPEQRTSLQNVKLLADKAAFESLSRSISLTDATGKTVNTQPWIYLTGYPADPYAQQHLSESRCHVRSTSFETTQRSKELQGIWTKLIGNWESPLGHYQDDIVEYRAMRDCFHEVVKQNMDRFFYDCSVYGGNSGGPIYYMDRAEGFPVVIGLPESYLQIRDGSVAAKPTPNCEALYLDKYIKPILSKAEMTSANIDVAYVFPDNTKIWNQTDRNTASASELPYATPMVSIVANSAWLKAHPYLLKQNASNEVKQLIDDAAKFQESN